MAGGSLLAVAVVGVVGGGGGTVAQAKGRADPVVELGRRLFFDPAVSKSRDNSCAQCHDPAHGFSSARRVDTDDFTLTRRHSQTLVDAALGKRFHWDGEFDSVQDLVTSRLSESGARPANAARASLPELSTSQLQAPSGGPGYGSSTPPTNPPPTKPPPSAPPPKDDAATAESASDDAATTDPKYPKTDAKAAPTDAKAAPTDAKAPPSDSKSSPSDASGAYGYDGSGDGTSGSTSAVDVAAARKAADAKALIDRYADGQGYIVSDVSSSPDGYGEHTAVICVTSTKPAHNITVKYTKLADGAKPGGAVEAGLRQSTDSEKDAKASEDAAKKAHDTAYAKASDGAASPSVYAQPSQPSAVPTPGDTPAATAYATPAQSAPEMTGGTPASAATPGGAGPKTQSPSWKPESSTPAPSAGSPSEPTPANPVGTQGAESKDGAKPSTARGGSVADRLDRDGRYGDAFQAAFGTRRVSVARIAEAIAAYVGSIRSSEAPFDRFLAGDTAAMSASAQRGLELFRGRAGCAQCHAITGSRPEFTDHRFHNTGISFRRPAPVISPDTGLATIVPMGREDMGLGSMSRAEPDSGAFKTPTLRDVAVRPPYMHDGSFPTLASVVRNYARGSARNDHLDPRVRPFTVSGAEVADLVAFLESLTGDIPPGLAPDFERRAARTTLRLADPKGHPLVGIRVVLEPAGDRLPGDVPVASRVVEAVTDEKGEIAFAPSRRTHTRVVLPEGLAAPSGSWIPDTCKSAEWTLPVAGETALLVHFPADSTPPTGLVAFREARPQTQSERETLAMWAPGVMRANQQRLAVFTLVGVTDVGGRPLARYRAWVPADAPKTAIVDLPAGDHRTLPSVEFKAGGEVRLDLTR